MELAVSSHGGVTHDGGVVEVVVVVFRSLRELAAEKQPGPCTEYIA